MLRKALLVAAVSGIALTTALAQSSAPTSPTSPAVTQPAPSTSRAPAPTATAPSTADKPMFITKQSADQHLASKFKGTDVLGPGDEKIGDVSDILFDDKGTVLAYIVGVGGFLGIGAKDVAIAPASFQKVPGQSGSAEKLRVSMTKDELKQAATFEPYTPPRPAASATPRPTTSPPAPAPAPAPRKE
jgi:PRC-barrel domain protein